MNHDLLLGSHLLRKGQIHRLRSAAGRRVECLNGVIWITQDGDRRDIVLEAGDAFTFDRDDDVLLSALADSRYVLLAACAPEVTAPAPSGHPARARA